MVAQIILPTIRWKRGRHGTKEEVISDTKVDTDRIVAGYYSILGQRLSAAPESGVYIILYDNGSAKKIIKP